MAFLRRAARSRNGFSLIELMVGFLIFSSCIIMILSYFTVSLNAVVKARNHLIATHLAEQKLEFIKTLSYADLVDGNPSLAAATASVQCVVNGVQVDYSFSEQVIISIVETDLKLVKSQVSWNEKGKTNYVVLGTYVYNE